MDRRILQQEPDLSNSDVNSSPSPLFKSLLCALLTKSVSKRINESDLIKHPFWHQRISVTEPVNSTENTAVINKTSADTTRSDESKLSTYEKVESTNITCFQSKNSDDTPTLSHYNEKLVNTLEGNEKPQSFDSAISNSDASTSSVPPVSEQQITNSNGHSIVNNTHNTDKLKMKKNQLYANDRMVQSEYNTATSTISQGNI
ncbi:unnamed protein product [Trichobilharzia regenti]|nr:unnamed protein product [Trichobilharzia regenti]